MRYDLSREAQQFRAKHSRLSITFMFCYLQELLPSGGRLKCWLIRNERGTHGILGDLDTADFNDESGLAATLKMPDPLSMEVGTLLRETGFWDMNDKISGRDGVHRSLYAWQEGHSKQLKTRNVTRGSHQGSLLLRVERVLAETDRFAPVFSGTRTGTQRKGRGPF